MALSDFNGTTSYRWSQVSDFDGTTNHIWGKAAEFTGTTTYTIFQNKITVTNIVSDSDEKVWSWQDIGIASMGPFAVKYFTAYSGHQYYVRTNLSCWAYWGAAGAYAKAVIRLPPTFSNGGDILEKSAWGGLDTNPIAGHWLASGDGKQWNLQIFGVRGNSSQGSMSTSNSMIVDVTALPSKYKVNADYVWGAIGAQFFRGSKTISLK